MSLDPTDSLDKSAFAETPHEAPPEKTLIWHKIADGVGFRPAAREGHTAVSSVDGKCFVFGGIEAGTRVNSTCSLDITTATWTAHKLKAGATAPCPRAFHAACMVDHVMFVHGGEGDGLSHMPVLVSVKPVSLGSESTTTEVLPSGEPNTCCAGGALDGDLLGLKHKADPRILHAESGGLSEARSLDDLYGFDTQSGEWRRVVCGLAPLPRRGHSMVLAPVALPSTDNGACAGMSTLHAAEVDCVVLFGGYCRETDSSSGSVLVCPARDLLSAFASASASAVSALHPAAGHAVNRACAWRTLQTRGQAPCPRQAHSATVLRVRGQAVLCVFGGLDSCGGALNDLYLLALGAGAGELTWSQVSRRAEAGDWPYPVFGHTAFAVPAQPSEGDSAVDGRGQSQALLVFGGMGAASARRGSGTGKGGGDNEDDDDETDPQEASARGCRADLLVCDVSAGSWRRLNGSMQAPKARTACAGAVCWGFSLAHALPLPLVAGAPRPSPGDMLQRLAADHRASRVEPEGGGPSQAGVVVVFGGRKEASYHADCWALDLRWRLAGVDGYDGSVAERTASTLAGLDLDLGAGLGSGTLAHSLSASVLPSQTGASISGDGVGKADGKALVGSTLHRARRERALADVHMARERARAEAAEALVARLAAQVEALSEQLRATDEVRFDETRVLRAAIEEGQSRERKLVALFDEAQRLLLLAGVNRALREEETFD